MLDNANESILFSNFTIKPYSKLERRKKELEKQKKQELIAYYKEQKNLREFEEQKNFRAWRLFLLLGTFATCFVIFILAVYAKIITKPPNMDPYNKYSRDYPWSNKVDIDLGLRGQILSGDNYILASSKKLYKVGIYVPSIQEEKKDVVINLLNIYANLNKDSIQTALNKGGNAIISESASSIDAINLRQLNAKLARLGAYKKCTFTYINKDSLEDSEFKEMIAHAEITSDKGRATSLDRQILKTLQDLQKEQITESKALQILNQALVEYKNRQIDLSKECYTPIFAYNENVKDNASTRVERGLDISVSSIEREYPFNNLMQPILGFTNYSKKKINENLYDDKLKFVAQSGVEKYRDGILSAKHDGRIAGRADRGGNIIFDKHSREIAKEDGFNITLSIPLNLQAKVQEILESASKQYHAEQIIAGIMNPHTGEILALASSHSFNPNVGQRDSDITSRMRVLGVERSFEPGSTIKPLIFSYLANKKWINYSEEIDLHNGIYNLRTFTIRDSTPLKSAKPEQILIKSSNIGMTKLTKNLSGTQMQELFKTFGVGENTGIDIANEANGLLPSVNKLNKEVEKGTASYGYGLRMTFIQLLRGYAVFNNGGYLVNPHVTKILESPEGKIFYPALESPKQIISKQSAEYMQKLLNRVVKEGTAKRADVQGLIVGGKTGTAREITREVTIYNGSFFGYASDGKTTYTIGVVAYGSQANEDYYGGQTAAPIFARLATLLATEGYLTAKH
ncbi:penicillin-binding protein 2 [Helicobacter saguini]|uniref:Penicillin-binding protein 2 n=2 Tax=Helicobacter saguini TaxID=1548018 RepID=A0A347W0Y7_9HELI|nr:penicillin-binding protein 2 [Helicobacter saguini]MWV66161.1 penicillin-binding protein 2 [Helicobacter saguini]MWV68510.1 penicillin-binding protein 2 [Helicobacter saguini]MWV71935.1 penicillin-binding protein 2 [Helicobacter saguini]TLD96003.1 penicillin-binding protein 2 [Helicobacter saguini]